MQYLMVKIFLLNIIRNSFLALIFLPLLSFSQEFKSLYNIPVKANYITSDYFNNFYIITDRGALVKYAGDKEISIFSKNKYGSLKFVDASNPLKLLLFYPDYSTIVVLDKNFSELGVHQLNLKGFQDVTAVGLSQDNKIWIYDKLNFRLKKIDENSEIILESENLSSLGFEINADYILHKNNWVYVNDPQQGVLVFDNYATYFKTIPIKGLSQFQVIDEQLIYYKDQQLQAFNLKTFEPAVIQMPFVDGISNLTIQKNRLFTLTNRGIEVFEY